MGFNKIAARENDKAFKPSTSEDLKNYKRRAREKKKAKRSEEEKEDLKSDRKVKRKLPRGTEAVKMALEQNQRVRTFNPQLFEKFLEHVKMLELSKPAYKLYIRKDQRDAAFMYEIQVCLAKMNWQQLTQLISIGTDTPIPTKSWTDAFHKALNVMISAFDVVDYLQTSKKDDYCRIRDREALDAWPVNVRQRRSGSTNEEDDDMHTDENNRSLRALAGDDDDDDDDDKSSKRGRSRDNDDDDDEDDEDEKPRKSFGKGKKKSPSKEKDEKPARKRRAAKDDDDDEDEKEEVTLTDRTQLLKAKDRDKGGFKTKLLDLLSTRKATSLKDLYAKADEEFGAGSRKVKKTVETLIGFGYIKTK